MLNEVTENIGNIWPESYIALRDVLWYGNNLQIEESTSLFTPIGATIILLLFVATLPMLFNGLNSIIRAIYNTELLAEIESSPSYRLNRSSYLLFSILLLSFLISKGEFVYFLKLFFGVLLFLFLRSLLFSIISWATKSNTFRKLSGIYCSYFGLWCIAIFLGVFLSYIVPETILQYITIFVAIMGALALLGYIISGYQLFILNGFSVSFWILYLCTLEILPLLVFTQLIA